MPHGSIVAGSAVLVVTYLIGSIPVAWLLGRYGRGVDLRGLGSGNPGTSNLFRNTGMRLAILSGPLQFAQGVAAVLVARAAGGSMPFVEVAAITAVIGNGWPLWLRFNGQRGIAVATGTAAALSPILLAVLLVCFAAGALSHAIAVGVLAGFSALPVAALWMAGDGLPIACVGLLTVIVLRRLEGLTGDLRAARSSDERRVLLRRLFLDERPGQVLAGTKDMTVPAKEH